MKKLVLLVAVVFCSAATAQNTTNEVNVRQGTPPTWGNLSRAQTWTQPQTFPAASILLSQLAIATGPCLIGVLSGTSSPICLVQSQLSALLNPTSTRTGGIVSPAYSIADANAIITRSNGGVSMNDPLPAPATVGAGFKLTIINADATATDTITPAAGTIIPGAGSALALGSGGAVIFISDGANWQAFLNSSGAVGPANVTTLTASSYITAAGAISSSAGLSGTTVTASSSVTAGGALISTGGSAPAAANGTVAIYGDPTNGAVFRAQGATNDGQYLTASGGNVWTLPHGLNVISFQALNVVGTAGASNGLGRCVANTLCTYSNGQISGTSDSGQHWKFGRGTGTGTTEPTIATNACGASPQGSIASGSGDMSGIVTVGGGTVSSCAVTFKIAWDNAPRACLFSPVVLASASGVTIGAPTTTGFTISGTTMASAQFAYHCF